MCVKTFDKYYEKLQTKYEAGKVDFELNENRAHNTTIVRFMLDNSNVINMYCGEMSVFRDNFYRYINEIENTEEPLGDYLKNKIIGSLSSFVNRENTILNIYLEKFSNDYFEDLIAPKIFNEGIATGKINIYKLNDKLLLKSGLTHVSYTDTNIIRMERDKYTHEAICAINVSKEMKKTWEDVFLYMQSAAESVCMPN